MHAIPEAIKIYNKYKDDGVRVLGIATAFEDFDKNTLENLRMLVETGQVIGETKNALSMYGQLDDGNKLPYKIPFPLGMDNMSKTSGEISMDAIMAFIYPQVPEFDRQLRHIKIKYTKSRDYLNPKSTLCRDV